MNLADLLSEKLLTFDEGIILFVGLFMGLVLGILGTFFYIHRKKDG
jgi:hypothetical protein